MTMSDEERDEQFYRDTEAIAFPKIDDRQLALLEPLGERLVLRRGEMVFEVRIRKMTGRKMLEAVELENTATGEVRTVETPAVFSMIGADPCTRWLPPETRHDEKGFSERVPPSPNPRSGTK